ncbi:MAG: hypothetical protein Tsb0014_38440 [Pleurocapsa sp.]
MMTKNPTLHREQGYGARGINLNNNLNRFRNLINFLGIKILLFLDVLYIGVNTEI